MTGLCDAHLHLQEPALQGVRQEILDTWTRLGLVHAVCNGTREADWDAVAAVAAEDSRIIPSFGLHPWYVDGRSDDWLVSLENRLRTGGGVIGEIGLDHSVDGRDDEAQDEVFLGQLALARSLDLPVSVHCVSAWGRLNEILQDNRSALPARGFLLHAYGGSAEMVPGFAALGARFSFSARAGHPGAVRLRRALESVPLDRLLIETDAPALPPPPEWTDEELVDGSTGQRLNHPANIASGYRFVSEFMDVPMDELVPQIRENFEKLFVRR